MTTPVASVLAVTPDARSRRWFESRLTWSPAYRIRCVPCGRDALRFLWRELFDVVVCDVALPDGTWQDLREEMSSFKHAPALVLAQDRPRSFARVPSGVYAVVGKPFVERELLNIIDQAARVASELFMPFSAFSASLR